MVRVNRISARGHENNGAVKLLRAEGASELVNIPMPPMLVEGLIPRGAMVMVVGPTHCGKTFFAAELVRALALQAPFAGHFTVPRAETSLFIEQDAPKLDTGRVIWAMIRQDWQQDWEGHEDQPLDAIRFLWHPGLDLWNGAAGQAIVRTANAQYQLHGYEQFADPIYDEHGDICGYTDACEEVGRKGTGLIVYDSWRSMHTGDENESGETEALMQDLKYIRAKTGATQLLLHHENAGGDRPRGSTALEAAMDMIFRLNRAKNSNIVTVTVTKARIVQAPSFKYEIVSDTGEDGKPVKAVRFAGLVEQREEAVQADKKGEFRTYLQSRPRTTRDEALAWAVLNGSSRSAIDRFLADFKGEGWLVSVRGVYSSRNLSA